MCLGLDGIMSKQAVFAIGAALDVVAEGENRLSGFVHGNPGTAGTATFLMPEHRTNLRKEKGYG